MKVQRFAAPSNDATTTKMKALYIQPQFVGGGDYAHWQDMTPTLTETGKEQPNVIHQQYDPKLPNLLMHISSNEILKALENVVHEHR